MLDDFEMLLLSFIMAKLPLIEPRDPTVAIVTDEYGLRPETVEAL